MATTDCRQPAGPLLSVGSPVVVPAIGVHDIRTGVISTLRAAAAAAADTEVSIPTTRGSEAVAG